MVYLEATSWFSPISSDKQAVPHLCSERRVGQDASKPHELRLSKHNSTCEKLHCTSCRVYPLLSYFSGLPIASNLHYLLYCSVSGSICTFSSNNLFQQIPWFVSYFISCLIFYIYYLSHFLLNSHPIFLNTAIVSPSLGFDRQCISSIESTCLFQIWKISQI